MGGRRDGEGLGGERRGMEEGEERGVEQGSYGLGLGLTHFHTSRGLLHNISRTNECPKAHRSPQFEPGI